MGTIISSSFVFAGMNHLARTTSGNLNTHPEELQDTILLIRNGRWSSPALPEGFGALRLPGTNEISIHDPRFPRIGDFVFRNVGRIIYYRRSSSTNWISTTGAGNETFRYSGGSMVSTTGSTTGGSESSTGPGSTGPGSTGLVSTAPGGGISLATTIRFSSTEGSEAPSARIEGARFTIEPVIIRGRLDTTYTLEPIQILDAPGVDLTQEELTHNIRFNMEPNGMFTNPRREFNTSPLRGLNIGAAFLDVSPSADIESSTILRDAGVDFDAEFYPRPAGRRGALRRINLSFTRPVAFSYGSQTFIVNDGTERTFRVNGRDITTEHTGVCTLNSSGDLVPYTPTRR